MDPELSDVLSHYFDVTLKKALGYRESYSSPTYDPYEGVIKFRKIDLNQPEDLKNVLVSNRDIVSQLKTNLISVLLPYFENLESISLIFDSDGFGIDIQRGNMKMLNVDPYVLIASRFATIDDLDNFCRSSKEAMTTCRTKEFWRGLLKQIYPGEYRGDYNYEHVYKGYIILRNPPLNYNPVYHNRLKEYINFIKNENLMTLDELYDRILRSVIKLHDHKLFKKIYKYNQEKFDTRTKFIQQLNNNLKIAIKDNDIGYIRSYLNIILNHKKYEYLPSPLIIISNAELPIEIKLTPEIWNVVYNASKNHAEVLKKRDEDFMLAFEDKNEAIDENLHEYEDQLKEIKTFNLVFIVNALVHKDYNLVAQILETKDLDFQKFITEIIPRYIQKYGGNPPKEFMQVISENIDENYRSLYDTILLEYKYKYK